MHTGMKSSTMTMIMTRPTTLPLSLSSELAWIVAEDVASERAGATRVGASVARESWTVTCAALVSGWAAV
jgi:hypothetical protein